MPNLTWKCTTCSNASGFTGCKAESRHRPENCLYLCGIGSDTRWERDVDESIQPKDSLDIAMGIPLDKKARRHRLRYKNVS